MFVLERLLSFVAPHECIVCTAEGRLVCAWCRLDFCRPIPSRCFLCRKATRQHAVCLSCRRNTPLRHVWVASELIDDAQKLLYLYKFDRAQAASREIADFMRATLPYSDDAYLVPIPPATTRLRQRGYDHTRLLARELAKQTGLPCLPALSRIGQSRQVGMKREVRLKQLKGAFRVRDAYAIKNRNILLIDDVVTTGATLNEAAKVLRKTGAASVDAVVFAQK